MILWQKTYWLSDDVSAAIEATPCMLKHTHSKASTLLSRHILRCAAAALLGGIYSGVALGLAGGIIQVAFALVRPAEPPLLRAA